MTAGTGSDRRASPSAPARRTSVCHRSPERAGSSRPSHGSERERRHDRSDRRGSRSRRRCRWSDAGGSPGHLPPDGGEGRSRCCSIQTRTSETANFRCLPNRYARGPWPRVRQSYTVETGTRRYDASSPTSSRGSRPHRLSAAVRSVSMEDSHASAITGQSARLAANRRAAARERRGGVKKMGFR